MPSPRTARWLAGLLCLGLWGAALLGTLSAGAELAVLTDGDFIKVRSYELQEERMRLELTSGGFLSLPLSRIERIVDDEVPLASEPAPEPPPPPQGFAMAFEEGQPVPDTPFGEIIYRNARRFRLNPELVAAVVRAESAFKPRAVSPKGARGLMQLMPATAARFGVHMNELFEPERNIEAGSRYLDWLLGRFGEDLPRVLAAYNAGEGAVDRYGGVPPYRETRGYLRRIYSTLGLSEDGSSPRAARSSAPRAMDSAGAP